MNAVIASVETHKSEVQSLQLFNTLSRSEFVLDEKAFTLDLKPWH